MRRCGHCFNSGHNRRGCPEIKKIIRDNPDGYQARLARTKKEHAVRNPRKCSYCKTTGHNKKTCDDLIRDRNGHANKASKWRIKFLSECRSHGFGVGTLLKFIDPSQIESDWVRGRRNGTCEKHGSYALVTDCRWDTLDHRQESRAQSSITIRFPSGYWMAALLPVEFNSLVDEYSCPQFEIAGPIDSSLLGTTMTSEWHTGFDSANWHLRM
jgi:hypothetical protein